MNCSKRWKKAPRRRSGLFNFLLTSLKGWEHNPRRSSPCSEVARTVIHDFKFRCRYPATFPRRSGHRGNEALRARSFVLCTGQREGACASLTLSPNRNSQLSAFAHNPKMQLILRMNVPRYRPTVANDVGDTG